MENQIESKLFTINEAANYLRISRTSLYRVIKDGRICTVQMLSRKQLIEKKVLDRFVASSLTTNWSCNDSTN